MGVLINQTTGMIELTGIHADNFLKELPGGPKAASKHDEQSNIGERGPRAEEKIWKSGKELTNYLKECGCDHPGPRVSAARMWLGKEKHNDPLHHRIDTREKLSAQQSERWVTFAKGPQMNMAIDAYKAIYNTKNEDHPIKATQWLYISILYRQSQKALDMLDYVWISPDAVFEVLRKSIRRDSLKSRGIKHRRLQLNALETYLKAVVQ